MKCLEVISTTCFLSLLTAHLCSEQKSNDVPSTTYYFVREKDGSVMRGDYFGNQGQHFPTRHAVECGTDDNGEYFQKDVTVIRVPNEQGNGYTVTKVSENVEKLVIDVED